MQVLAVRGHIKRIRRPLQLAGRRNEAGFTLPEIIAAIAILALALGPIVGHVSNALHRTSQAEAMAQAGSLAQSLLARAGSELAIAPGTTTGEFASGYRWRLEVTPYGNAEDQRAWPVAAYSVSVEVMPGNMQERSVMLTTLRLVPKGPVR
jgi:general secretion pathway protein I